MVIQFAHSAHSLSHLLISCLSPSIHLSISLLSSFLPSFYPFFHVEEGIEYLPFSDGDGIRLTSEGN